MQPIQEIQPEEKEKYTSAHNSPNAPKTKNIEI